MKMTAMRAQHAENPLGYQMNKPVLSWIVSESTGKDVKAARVRVAADAEMHHILHDSGEGVADSLAYSVPLALSPRTRYYWNVTVTADDGDTDTSPTAFFETGKMGEAWAGQWIAMPGDPAVHPILRKRFSLDSVPDARLYICGLGLYEAYINGQKVGEDCLAPFHDSYDRMIQAQTYDVTALLRPGENELTVWLGMGWYMGRFGFNDTDRLYGERMQLLCEMRAGENVILCSDESWQAVPSPITMSGIYDGEDIDARLENPAEWTKAETVPPPEGKICDRLSPPVRVTEELPVSQLIHTPAGEWVLDFGQEVTGWVRFGCCLPAGREVRLAFGEILQHDCFYRDNLRSARQELHYVSAGREAVVRPRFTYFGFRYVKVEGMTEAEIRSAGFAALVIHSDLGFTGALETSDPLVNRLIANIRWGQRGNFLDVPTDCPQRDERMGWTGDAQVFCPTASYNMYTPAFYRKFLADMRLEQERLEGAVPHVVPDALNARHRRKKRLNPAYTHGTEEGSCAWADAATVIPWTVYRFYGDRELLREAYPGMKAWVEWVKRQEEEHCGGKRIWACGFHFADWLALDNPDKESRFGGTDVPLIATAYYYLSASLTARAARALGEDADGARYEKLAEEIRAAWQKEYFGPDGCRVQTQTALCVALQFGLAPENLREKTAAQLKKLLEAKNMHLDTGFVGTPLLLPALTGNGMHGAAVTLLLNTDYPGWLYEVTMGATTVWERWNSVMPNGLVSDTGMNSLNHYAYGSVAAWMYEDLCGLKETEPGFRRARIAPKPDPRLAFARCAYDSASGRYACGWERRDGETVYRAQVPFGCRAEIVLPGEAPFAVGPGAYEWVRKDGVLG